MQTPLNASASSAGALISNTTFEIPPFQREYSWGKDEAAEFWTDLSNNIESESYFLGLIILTEEDARKHVVDGQQRIITLTLLATAIYHEALARGRSALADRIQADFLRSIDYETDEVESRVKLSDERDNDTFQTILNTGSSPIVQNGDSVSSKIIESFKYLKTNLENDLKQDPFKRLGMWTRFLTDRLYFAVFIHPDSSSAYQVYEVINTRGKELTTADLLKNYALSQTSKAGKDPLYKRWKDIQRKFTDEGANNFVQFIRHAITVKFGHIPPKDLFAFLANRQKFSGKTPPTVPQLMTMLENHLPLYLQMIDPSLDGPAESHALKIFSALNDLGVIAVRPLLLAIAEVPDSREGMDYVLQLVVRRIIVGNLGTGNVERKFGESSRKVSQSGDWKSIIPDLEELNPDRIDFERQIQTRSFNKAVSGFILRSIIQKTTTPEKIGTPHYIWTPQASSWSEMSAEDGSYWASTIGNTFLAEIERRPKGIDSWGDFKTLLLPYGISEEQKHTLSQVANWDSRAVESTAGELAQESGDIWFND